MSSSWNISNTLPEGNTANDSYVIERTVTGSYDPNDKTAVTSSRSAEGLYLIDTDEYLDYTIRFQNTGTDTAFTVVITDTLSADLDMSSFQSLISSHAVRDRIQAGPCRGMDLREHPATGQQHE